MKNDAGRILRRLASRGPKPRILNFSRLTPKPAQATWGQKITTALKEWGAVATLLIAILYTFPVGLKDRLTSTREKQLIQSRPVLSDGGSLMIERILNTSKTTDPRALELMNNMYNVKYYNLIYSNRGLLKESINYLRSSELSTMAGLLYFSGLTAEALAYYDIAEQRAKEEGVPYANILRDKAQAPKPC